MATNFVQIENDSELKQRLEAERMRLRKIAGLDQPTHFHRPIERAFTAAERSHVTILFGGFTWKHEALIRAVFQGCGRGMGMHDPRTTRVEPCIFGGTPDCNQCGCVISSGLHRVQKVRIAGPLKVEHLVRDSMAIGSLRNWLRSKSADPSRWNRHPAQQTSSGLVQIGAGDRSDD